MKLAIVINNGNFQFHGEASSIIEFDALRDYLKKEGFIGNGQAAPSETKTPDTPPAKAEEVKPDPKAAADKLPKAEAKKEAPAKKETSAEKPAKAAVTAKTAAGPTIEDVTAVLTAVADKFGVPEALIMNQRFGVKKAGELKPEQYAEYITFAKHCVDDGVEPSGSHPDFDGAGAEEGEDVSALV